MQNIECRMNTFHSAFDILHSAFVQPFPSTLQMNLPDLSPNRARPSIARGAWTIAAIFALAIAVTVGLFLAPKTKSPPVPAGIVEGFPDRRVSIAVVDGSNIGPQPERLIQAIRNLTTAPDIVMLIGVDSSVLPAIVEVFGMQGSFHPQLYQHVKSPDGRDRRGAAILSRHALYAGAAANAGDRPNAGVQAVATIDGRTFRLTCLDSKLPSSSTAIGVAVGFGSDDQLMARLTPTADASGAGALTGGRSADGREIAGEGTGSTRKAESPAWRLETAARHPELAPAALFILRRESDSAPATAPSPATAPGTRVSR
jgi:hypothetical protein